MISKVSRSQQYLQIVLCRFEKNNFFKNSKKKLEAFQDWSIIPMKQILVPWDAWKSSLMPQQSHIHAPLLAAQLHGSVWIHQHPWLSYWTWTSQKSGEGWHGWLHLLHIGGVKILGNTVWIQGVVLISIAAIFMHGGGMVSFNCLVFSSQ